MPDKEREEKRVNGEATDPEAVTGVEAPAAESLPEQEAAQNQEASETLSPEERIRALEAALGAAEAKAAEYYQQLLRLRADFENLRRRVNKEREEFLHFAGEALVTALLPVLDDFERALQAPGEQVADFLAGVDMIYRRLSEILAREGLEPIPAVGQEFDPNRHEAVAYETGEDGPRNTVIEEFRRGYMFRGKVIRPALVKVAKEKE
ncbi:MAG: nucleotide exchange factor GrpE [Thermodesulfitimonas sp.]